MVAGPGIPSSEAPSSQARSPQARSSEVLSSETSSGSTSASPPSSSSRKSPSARGLVDDLSSQVRQRFVSRWQGTDQKVAEVSTDSVDAYRAIVEGRRLLWELRDASASKLVLEAVEIDSGFALRVVGGASITLEEDSEAR